MVQFFQTLFTPITNVLGGMLMFFHGLGLPWWIAIALLTIVVRSVLFPLTVKQVKSMRQMQELRPRLQELQEKHKGDRQKLQEEQMKLYQEAGVNPVGGCLPLIIQMPIFIGIFYTIRKFGGTEGMIGVPDTAGTIHSFTTGGALWFQNLSHADPIHLLPIISAITMVGSMEMTNKSMEPNMRWVMRFMPIVFVFFTIFFPAGLLMYIVTNNFVTLFQNYLIYHRGPGRQNAGDENKAAVSKDSAQEKGSSGKQPADSPGGDAATKNGGSSSSGAREGSRSSANSSNGSSKSPSNSSGASPSKRRKKKKKR